VHGDETGPTERFGLRVDLAPALELSAGPTAPNQAGTPEVHDAPRQYSFLCCPIAGRQRGAAWGKITGGTELRFTPVYADRFVLEFTRTASEKVVGVGLNEREFNAYSGNLRNRVEGKDLRDSLLSLMPPKLGKRVHKLSPLSLFPSSSHSRRPEQYKECRSPAPSTPGLLGVTPLTLAA